jgi:hypothetical protein
VINPVCTSKRPRRLLLVDETSRLPGAAEPFRHGCVGQRAAVRCGAAGTQRERRRAVSAAAVARRRRGPASPTHSDLRLHSSVAVRRGDPAAESGGIDDAVGQPSSPRWPCVAAATAGVL